MESHKICDLDLIENTKKKNKKEDKAKFFLHDLKNKLFNIIDNLIDHDTKLQKKEDNIKIMLVKFIEIYININRSLKNRYNKNSIVKEIINETISDMIDNIIFRCKDDETLIKEIVILKKIKRENTEKIESIEKIT